MELHQLEKEYTIHVYETGPDGRLALCSLFDFLQDSASEHAVKLGYGRDDLMRQNSFWVLSRMYTVISDLPGWNEKITVRTWPRGTDKIFAVRDYIVTYPDGRIIASATSSWLILNQLTRKILRPDHTLVNYNINANSENSLLRNASRLEPADPEGRIDSRFNVRISDLDINHHTNNVRYLKWILDSYDLDFVMYNSPASVEINYLAESHYNEEIIIRTSEEKENRSLLFHSIFRSEDNKELCRVRIVWKEKNT
jgi:acyl-ACP thioesterase